MYSKDQILFCAFLYISSEPVSCSTAVPRFNDGAVIKIRTRCHLNIIFHCNAVTSADFVVILLQVASQSFLFHRIHELEGPLLLVRGSPANNARSRCPHASSVKIAPGLIPLHAYLEDGEMRCGTCMVCLVLMGRRA